MTIKIHATVTKVPLSLQHQRFLIHLLLIPKFPINSVTASIFNENFIEVW